MSLSASLGSCMQKDEMTSKVRKWGIFLHEESLLAVGRAFLLKSTHTKALNVLAVARTAVDELVGVARLLHAER